MKITPRIVTCVLVAHLTQGVSAQTPRPSRDNARSATITVSAQRDVAAGKLRIVDGTSHVVPVGIDSFGYVAVLADDRVLACGRKDGPTSKGVLSVLEANASTGVWSEVGTYELAGADFTGVAYDDIANKLYLLDGVNKKVLCAPYTSGPGVALPTVWTTFATQAQVPALASAIDQAIYFIISTDGSESRILLRHYGRPLKDSWTIEIGTLEVVTIEGPEDRRVALRDTRTTDLSTSLNVAGPPGAGFDVVDATTSLVVASGVVGSSGEATLAIPPLAMGSVYRIKAHNYSRPGPLFTPLRFWGSSDTLPTGHKLEEYSNDGIGLTAYIGNSRFADITSAAAPPGGGTGVYPITYTASLVVGTEGDIVQIGGEYILNGSVHTADNLRIPSKDKNGYSMKALPIPHDPMLVGSVMCLQWWITTPTQTYCSSIVGGYVRDSTFTSLLFASTAKKKRVLKARQAAAKAVKRARNGMSEAQVEKARREALRDWLASIGGKKMTVAELKRRFGPRRRSKK